MLISDLEKGTLRVNNPVTRGSIQMGALLEDFRSHKFYCVAAIY
jgi:hypothetical protein